MLKTIKQARAAVSLLNPDEVRKRAERPVHIGLVAATSRDYEEMEEFLLPREMPREIRAGMHSRVHRADAPHPPSKVDLVLYHRIGSRTKDAYTFHPDRSQETITDILHDHHDELSLALARQFPAFRQPVIDRIVTAVARENALFAITTALPNVIPNLIELPWAFGEFASDTAFLTANQVRMAFLIAAACGKDAGIGHQKAQVLAIVGSAFGWRAVARELAGKIPMGGGLIPKGAIAYAGTVAVGKGLEYFYRTDLRFTREQHKSEYRKAMDRGKEVAQSVAGPLPG